MAVPWTLIDPDHPTSQPNLLLVGAGGRDRTGHREAWCHRAKQQPDPFDGRTDRRTDRRCPEPRAQRGPVSRRLVRSRSAFGRRGRRVNPSPGRALEPPGTDLRPCADASAARSGPGRVHSAPHLPPDRDRTAAGCRLRPAGGGRRNRRRHLVAARARRRDPDVDVSRITAAWGSLGLVVGGCVAVASRLAGVLV